MATWRSFLKEYDGHIRDSRKTDLITQQPFSICGEKILDFSFQSIDQAYFHAEKEGKVAVCPKCWIKIENTMKTKQK